MTDSQSTALPASLPEARTALAIAMAGHRLAEDRIAAERAYAERRAIEAANGDIGKNEADRTRHLTIALAEDEVYQAALHTFRSDQASVGILKAYVDGLRDAQRDRQIEADEKHASGLDRSIEALAKSGW